MDLSEKNGCRNSASQRGKRRLPHESELPARLRARPIAVVYPKGPGITRNSGGSGADHPEHLIEGHPVKEFRLRRKILCDIREEAIATVKLGARSSAAQVAQISIGFVILSWAGVWARSSRRVAVGSSVWFTVIVLCIGLWFGESFCCAALRRRQASEIGHCVRQGLWLSLAAAAACFLVLRAIEPVLDWLMSHPSSYRPVLVFSTQSRGVFLHSASIRYCEVSVKEFR